MVCCLSGIVPLTPQLKMSCHLCTGHKYCPSEWGFSDDSQLRYACGYLNSQTSPPDPQRSANAAGAALNDPPAQAVRCWSERGGSPQPGNGILRWPEHPWHGARSRASPAFSSVTSAPAVPAQRCDGKEEHTQPRSPSVAASASVAEPEMFKCACL